MKGKRLLVVQLQMESGFMKDAVILGLIRILNIKIDQNRSCIFRSRPLPDSVIKEWVTPGLRLCSNDGMKKVLYYIT